MNEVFIRSSGAHNNGYCSQPRTPLPPVRNIEQWAKVIEEILKKTILCRHDVKMINKACHEIVRLERQMDEIPDYNSQYVLEKIVKKIEKIAKEKNILGLISLYHLQSFSDKSLSIENHFNRLWGQVKKSAETNKLIATYLPCCDSETDFNQDIFSLVGPDPDEEVAKILGRKKAQLQSYVQTKEKVENRRSELNELRKTHSQNYPDYLDELLDNGYFYLYDHLIQMRILSDPDKHKSAIEEMTFSLLSHIVLEAREAIIQKVEGSIPNDHRNMIFLLGRTEAGKSTTFCFLRGDEMVEVLDRYESKRDKNQLIRHGTISHTFLPTTEVIKDWVVIDFPGFDDTNGQLICLGMECALKALVKKYHPRVLVLESILDIEGKLTDVAKLGSRLERLLGNKESCVLGITKYTKDPDFKNIRKLENTQKAERLNPTQDEMIKLEGQIKNAPKFRVPASRIQELNQKLANLKEEKEAKLKQPLPETDLKTERRESIQNKENEILKNFYGNIPEQIKLESIFRFDNLTDSTHVSSCFATLSERKPIYVNSMQILDPHDEELLKKRFENNLVKELETKTDYQITIKEFEEFKQTVLESSLISTILSRSNPEIGSFLHLPEINPKIVREFDKKIAGQCMRKFMISVIRMFNISKFEIILNEIKTEAPKLIPIIEDLRKMLTKVRDYILGLKGIPHEDQEQARKEYDRIREKYLAAEIKAKEKFDLSNWYTILGYALPLGIPLGINELMKWSAGREAKESAIIETLYTCCKEVKETYKTLVNLKDIENILEKQDSIDAAFKSVRISTASIEALNLSIKARINRVRSLYGPVDWDRRVSLLANEFSLTPFDPNNRTHTFCLTAYAYLLIEPRLFFTLCPVRGHFIIVLIPSEEGAKDLRNDWYEHLTPRHKIESLLPLFDKDREEIVENTVISIQSRKGDLPILGNLEKFVGEKLSLNRAMSAAALFKKYS